MSFYEEIIFKNIMALYIRAGYDSILVKIIIDDIHQTKTEEQIHNMAFEITRKIGIIYSHEDASGNKVVLNNHRDLINKISANNTMFNDFSHSANLFLTPLIDVSLERLYEIYDDFMNTSSGSYANIAQEIGF